MIQVFLINEMEVSVKEKQQRSKCMAVGKRRVLSIFKEELLMLIRQEEVMKIP